MERPISGDSNRKNTRETWFRRAPNETIDSRRTRAPWIVKEPSGRMATVLASESYTMRAPLKMNEPKHPREPYLKSEPTNQRAPYGRNEPRLLRAPTPKIDSIHPCVPNALKEPWEKIVTTKEIEPFSTREPQNWSEPPVFESTQKTERANLCESTIQVERNFKI